MKKVMLIIGLIVVLGGVAAAAFFIGKSSGSQNSSNSTKQVVKESNTQADDGKDKASDDTKVTKDSDEKDKAKKSVDANVTYKVGNSWENAGKQCTQIEAVVSNGKKQDVSDWSVSMTVPKGAKLDQGWNAIYDIKGTTLTIKPESYNATVPANGTVNFGFILKTKDSFSPEQSTLVMDGENYDIKGLGDEVAFANADEAEDDSEAANDDSEDASSSESKGDVAVEKNPVKSHGKLSVKGTHIVDEKGKEYCLKGVSTHGIAWFPQYVSKASFQTLRDTYHVNAIRLAMYSNPADGYKKSMHDLVCQGVDYATQLGMYVIIDWHILNDNNPNINKKSATAFFKEMTEKYKDYDNVIYEICNEPNGDVTWERDVKPYAESMISTIRKTDKDAIIIVGTPTWSQDVDKVAENPIKGEKNIMYACHFYAATHKDDLRNKVNTALKAGLPIIISEYSICEASGNGGIDAASAKQWFDIIKKQKMSCFAWNLSNKDESSSLIAAGCEKESGWKQSDLSQAGKWIFKMYSSYK